MASLARLRPVEIIAHRGSSFLAPENTLAALKLGWQETTTCEIDVRPTRDGRLLVIHDASTRRTTGVDFLVSQMTLPKLKQLDAGSWKGAPWNGKGLTPSRKPQKVAAAVPSGGAPEAPSNSSISVDPTAPAPGAAAAINCIPSRANFRKDLKLPSLDEALAAMPIGKQLLIEVKAGPEVVPELARVIRASRKGRRVLLHSFNEATCIAARKALPRAIIFYLIAAKYDRRQKKWTPSLAEASAFAQKAHLNGIGANDTSLITPVSVRKLHAAGLKLNIWTVDRVADARRLITVGVDGLITNRPGWLEATLTSSSVPSRQRLPK